MRWLLICLLVLGCTPGEYPGRPAEAAPPYEFVKCDGKFEELGPYKGVQITCADGRKFLFWPNKYIYGRRTL